MKLTFRSRQLSDLYQVTWQIQTFNFAKNETNIQVKAVKLVAALT